MEAAAPPASKVSVNADPGAGGSAARLRPPMHRKPDRSAHETLTTSLSDAIKNEKLEAKRSLERIADRRNRFREATRDMKSQTPGIGSSDFIKEIEAQIAKLQDRHDHQKTSVKEKKKISGEIVMKTDALKTLQSTAAAYADRIETLVDMDEEVVLASNILQELDEKLSTFKARLDAWTEAVHHVEKRRAHTQTNIPLLQDELRKCWDANKEDYKQIKQLNAGFKRANEVYWEAEQEYWAWCKWDRENRRQTRRQEAAERAQLHAPNPGEMFNEEVGYCDQLMAYLSKFVNADAKAGAVDVATVVAPASLDGWQWLYHPLLQSLITHITASNGCAKHSSSTKLFAQGQTSRNARTFAGFTLSKSWVDSHTDDYISNGEANNYYSAQDSVAIEIPFSGELDAIKKKKQELNEEFSHLLELKKAIKATLENVKTRLHDVRVEVRENEAADSGVQDAKKIERQMRELEHYHDHTSIPLREEIKLLEDIQKLKKNLRVLQARNRPHDLKKRDLDSLVTQFNSIKVVIKGYDTELDNISKQKKGGYHEEKGTISSGGQQQE
ncbi:g5696 [Coccomyxa elongata]